MNFENVDGIIFDLDGTLWDTTKAITESWKNVLANHPEIDVTITEKDIEGVMGLQIDVIGKRFFPDLDDKVRSSLLKECCENDNNYLKVHGGKLYPKLEETLVKLRENHKLFIVSNCVKGYIEAFLESHRVEEYFDDFENPGRTGLSKGENIKLIVERNNLKNPIYVGDTNGDKEAARVANIPFVYAAYGFGDVKDYDGKINSINELLKLK